jgi:hypothetical protein
MMANKLHINTGKSCYIEFSKPHEPVPPDNSIDSHNNAELCINGLPLQKVESTIFLGVTIDKNLN